MFSLIIVIISIALVALLALAALYYGGTSFNKSTHTADTAKLLAQGQQLSSAMQLYFTDKGAYPTGTASDIENTLVSSGYLTQWPSSDWTVTDNYVTLTATALDSNACLSMNQKLGVNTVPLCSDPAYANMTLCCSN